MANPYGRKGKTPAANSITEGMTSEQQLEVVQRQLLILQNANEELAQKLQDALVNQATMAGGGAVAQLSEQEGRGLSLTADPDISISVPANSADFGPMWLVRVFSDNAPGQTKIPCVVQVGRKARNGKIAIFRRRFYTDTEIELPEWAIQTLEYPETREYLEEVGSVIYEAAMRGDEGPAREACQKMGFEKVVWQGEQLKYVANIRHYTVSRIAKREGRLFVPAV